MLHARRVVAFLCLVAILLAALTPASASSGLFAAILVPLWFVFAAVVIRPLRCSAEEWIAPAFPLLPVLTPRPPPAA